MKRSSLGLAGLAGLVVCVALGAALASGAPVQTPKRGGTVVLNVVGPVPCLNFLDRSCVRAGNVAPRDFGRQIFHPAFRVASDGTYRPHLVSRVELTTKPPYTLIYRIRPEARWSDGVPVSAADFVFTYQALRMYLGPDEGDNHGTAIRNVAALGPKTVRVVLRTRYAAWRALFDVVLPRHALVGEDLTTIWADTIDNPKTGDPIGSGPFLVEGFDYTRDDPQLVMRRNPRYWGQHVAYLDRIVHWWSGLDPAGALAALRSGRLHSTLVPDPDLIDDARRIPGVRVAAFPLAQWEHLVFRIGPGGHPALRDKRVRRALAYGIDRDALVREQFRRIDPRARPSQSAIFLAESRRYEPTWSRYRYRPALARSLLARAGCRLGTDGVRTCTQGGRLSLRFVTTAGRDDRAQAFRVLQVQLAVVGIRAEPLYVAGRVLFDSVLPSGAFDVALFGLIRFPSLEDQLATYGCGGSRNATGYCQRLVTRELDQSDRILDAHRRAEVLSRVDAQLARDVPVLPLYQLKLTIADRASFRGAGWNPWPTAIEKSENWWLER